MDRLAIVQFWDKDPPAEVLRVMQTWERGPSSESFAYTRFDDCSAAEFISANFDTRTFRAYLQCGVPAMKADFFRYCYLYKNAGIYVDADIACARNLSSLCNGLDRGLLFWRARPPKQSGQWNIWPQRREQMPSGSIPEVVKLPNGFIVITTKHDKLLEYVIDMAVANIEARKSNNIWVVTGPGIMSSLYNSKSPESVELFRGFSVVPERKVREFIEFRGGFQYKRSDLHWTNAQSKGSIYSNIQNDPGTSAEPKVT